MSFLEVIDNLIVELNLELKKVKEAKYDKEYHSKFVVEKMNGYINDFMKNDPDNPAASLGKALTKVPQVVTDCFDHVERIESNILAAGSAYKKVRDAYIAYEKSQKEQDVKEEESTLDEDDSRELKIRKIGERPVNKLKDRDKKKEEKK